VIEGSIGGIVVVDRGATHRVARVVDPGVMDEGAVEVLVVTLLLLLLLIMNLFLMMGQTRHQETDKGVGRGEEEGRHIRGAAHVVRVKEEVAAIPVIGDEAEAGPGRGRAVVVTVVPMMVDRRVGKRNGLIVAKVVAPVKADQGIKIHVCVCFFDVWC